MRIRMLSVFVEDQRKAHTFYTETLGFVTKHDIPLGEAFWLTVTAPDDPDGPELLLEPNQHPVAQAYQAGLVADGIPCAQFAVDDVQAEYERLTALGVVFTQAPLDMGTVVTAVFDDTCGNLIQIASVPIA